MKEFKKNKKFILFKNKKKKKKKKMNVFVFVCKLKK